MCVISVNCCVKFLSIQLHLCVHIQSNSTYIVKFRTQQQAKSIIMRARLNLSNIYNICQKNYILKHYLKQENFLYFCQLLYKLALSIVQKLVPHINNTQYQYFKQSLNQKTLLVVCNLSNVLCFSTDSYIKQVHTQQNSVLSQYRKHTTELKMYVLESLLSWQLFRQLKIKLNYFQQNCNKTCLFLNNQLVYVFRLYKNTMNINYNYSQKI
eukprot:TRINITY_DN2962_c0_g2_i8.p1 TRINITY_DN2962_c0_g2~~TRINITY_DN2962_c0_g2_i8.p1  ORF type:complete len:211 (-),score=-37.78 TRINITY_DN2962_c0_g2_i8:427-1059(-)